MKVEYDSEADAAYIYFKKIKPGEVKQTIVLNDNLIVDLNKKGKLLGLEILDATSSLTQKTLKELPHKKASIQAA